MLCVLALMPMICFSADEPQAISAFFQVCIRDPSRYEFTFVRGIDGIMGTIRRNGHVVNYEISRYPGPDKFEDDAKKWTAVGAKELPSTMSLVTEYGSSMSSAERLYGFTSGTFDAGEPKHPDRTYVKLWADSKKEASELLPRVGAALYRCDKGARPIREGIP
ncbi:hypothetical protein [Dyella sp. EPa41]|uniref:hypothetical protein n=1 Tax=Dyella sp. EPa41 TaxID=1561194 RepID=UPI001916855C|nr:hypothetical protein [Dyella sp. EPa41]